eukprot:TRINITY_DN14944_c0_g1_i1.p1 TRINITY_DN14944_c0_g1~~TRINITY_DN14944_c0_g1_i1.p1  ORF type:complete len:415 (+),score=40.01 TRINITY_DN14944_c0_g1_i1:26-1246(+)
MCRWVWVSLLVLLMSCSSDCLVSSIEWNTLASFYNSTQGSLWATKTNWLKNDPCEGRWYGVSCDPQNTTTLKLALSSNGLNGTIPSSVALLTALSSLDLFVNYLSGTLPPQLGTLKKLTYLSLTLNRLSGIIPSSFGELSSLQSLLLCYNKLSGTIPASLTSLPDIQLLSLCSNNLIGTIPLNIGQLSTLKTLILSLNQLSGSMPSSIGSLVSLTRFEVQNNKLSGTLPSTLGSLTSLGSLNLSNNLFGGSLPIGMAHIFNLISLSLINNTFCDACFPFNYTISSCHVEDVSFLCNCSFKPCGTTKPCISNLSCPLSVTPSPSIVGIPNPSVVEISEYKNTQSKVDGNLNISTLVLINSSLIVSGEVVGIHSNLSLSSGNLTILCNDIYILNFKFIQLVSLYYKVS